MKARPGRGSAKQSLYLRVLDQAEALRIQFGDLDLGGVFDLLVERTIDQLGLIVGLGSPGGLLGIEC